MRHLAHLNTWRSEEPWPNENGRQRLQKPLTPVLFGAGEESRTPDLRITNALLYQLSYTGEKPRL